MGPRGGGPLSLPRLPRGSFVYFHSLPLGAYPGRLARFRSLSFGGLVLAEPGVLHLLRAHFRLSEKFTHNPVKGNPLSKPCVSSLWLIFR